MPIGGPTGGGQAGFGSGGSFTGPAKSIELVGNHLYAYSGVVQVVDSETALIEATTGNYYTVAEVQFLGDFATGDNYRAKVYLNDSVVMQFLLSSVNDVFPFGYYPFNLIIPSYTDLKVTLERTNGSGTNNLDIQITGRIYRG